jgi:hypothetical protein
MRPIILVVAFLVVSSTALAADGDSVLLASRRGGWVEAISLQSLETVSRVKTPRMTESVASDPSGQHLFVAAPKGPGEPCCALYALDPQSMRLSFLIEPAMSATITPGRLFAQRGNVGIEAFELQTLSRLPTIKAPAIYRLRASPDGRLLFGIANWRQPSLDLFDAAQGVMIASHALPNASSFAGTWLGDRYFLFMAQSGHATLQLVSSDRGEPGQPVALASSARFADCPQSPYDMIASGGNLAIYGQFGLKSDGLCGLSGGFVIADPATGTSTGRFAPGSYFSQMVASADGKYLYGLDVGGASWAQVRIVEMDASTGNIIAEKALDADVWRLTMGRIPHQLEGRLDLVAIAPPKLP